MSLLPHNATQLERALEAAADLGLDPDIIRGVADSARCPPNFLPGWPGRGRLRAGKRLTPMTSAAR